MIFFFFCFAQGETVNLHYKHKLNMNFFFSDFSYAVFRFGAVPYPLTMKLWCLAPETRPFACGALGVVQKYAASMQV